MAMSKLLIAGNCMPIYTLPMNFSTNVMHTSVTAANKAMRSSGITVGSTFRNPYTSACQVNNSKIERIGIIMHTSIAIVELTTRRAFSKSLWAI